ncbi:MAG TPA: mersacidin/lichenicidin family type 2 lantibiotic [Pyrinomonadaceae bacterium]|nr:mersacidin/lichenicidin family type 2 lantibiotic [Pyrinomonadaceae bacterium]
MSSIDIIRAWKDEDYRSSLTEAERAQLPDNPAGLVELTDADLSEAAGGTVFPTLYSCALCETLRYCPSQITVCQSYNYCPSRITFCPIEPLYEFSIE